MELSARNQLAGRVTAVKTGAIMAEVEIEVTTPVKIVAEVTKGSVERLNLQEGDNATAIIKATAVIVGK